MDSTRSFMAVSSGLEAVGFHDTDSEGEAVGLVDTVESLPGRSDTLGSEGIS